MFPCTPSTGAANARRSSRTLAAVKSPAWRIRSARSSSRRQPSGSRRVPRGRCVSETTAILTAPRARRRPARGAEADGIVRRQAGLRLGAATAARASSSSSARVFSATAATRAGRASSASRSCSSTSSLQRRDRVRPAAGALDVRPRLVAEHERVRGAAVVEPERDARVGRMEERALALDAEQLAAAPRPSTTSRSAAPAMKSATTASTEMPHPAIAIRSGPWARTRARSPGAAPRGRARARRSSSRSRSRSRP